MLTPVLFFCVQWSSLLCVWLPKCSILNRYISTKWLPSEKKRTHLWSKHWTLIIGKRFIWRVIDGKYPVKWQFSVVHPMWKFYYDLSEVLNKILIKILSYSLIKILTCFLPSSYMCLTKFLQDLTCLQDFTKILLRSYQDVIKILLVWYLDLTKILLRFCKIKRSEKNFKL